MIRHKTRKQPVLLISSAIVLIVALLVGAVFFLLPKVTAANANHSMNATRKTDNTVHTTNATTKTSNTSQVVAQHTQPASTTTKTSSQPASMDSGNNTQPAPATVANNGNQAPAAPTAIPPVQISTISPVMLNQYAPNIRHMVAQSFNITDVALAQDLQSGMHLTNIAAQYGFSNTQLQTLLSSSIMTSFQPAISTGSLTQTQVSSFIQQTQQNPTTLEQQLSIIPPGPAHW